MGQDVYAAGHRAGDGGSTAWQGQTASYGWPGWGSSDRPRTVVLERMSEPSDTEAPRDGDRAHSARQPKQVSCTNFKAFKTSKQLIQSPNHFCYTLEGILCY